MRKKYRIIIILIIFLNFIFINNIKAIDDYGGGTWSPNYGSLGKGQWNTDAVGVKISIISPEGTPLETKIIVNNSKSNINPAYLCSDLRPKMYQSTNITWTKEKQKITVDSDLPKDWYEVVNGVKGTIDLHDYLIKDNYKLLNKLIDTYFSVKPYSGCYISVESMTNIQGFYGTAFELGNAFLKLDESDCKKNGNFCYRYKGSVFGGDSYTDHKYGIFYTSLYLDKLLPEGSPDKLKNLNLYNNLYKDTDNNRSACLKSNVCGRGIGIFKYEDINPNIPEEPITYSLTIYKKDRTTSSGISGVTFTLNGQTCTTDINGKCTFNGLASGIHTLTETPKSGYSSSITCEGCDYVTGLTMNVDIIDSNKTITVYNEKSCSSELESYGTPTRAQLINLYRTYKYKDLLNFNNPSCTSNVSQNTKKSSGCMYGKATLDNFNENNLSGFEEEYIGSNYTAFCGSSFEFTNVLGITSPYNFGTHLSGRMYLNLSSGKIGEGTVTEKCYIYGTSGSFQRSSSNYKNYIGDVYIDGVKLKETLSDIEDPKTTSSSGYSIRTWEYKATYEINPVYAKNGSGQIEYNSCTNCKLIGYGFVSELYSGTGIKNKTIPFNLYGKYEITDNTSCTYGIKNEIVKGNGLNVEFRSVQPDNPFPGQSGTMREAKRNWNIKSLDTNGDEKIDEKDYQAMSKMVEEYNSRYDINRDGKIDNTDLKVMEEYIRTNKDTYGETLLKNSPNSYGIIPATQEKVSPKYVIILTPETIKKVRSYNSTRGYDDYTLRCDSEGKNCKSTFLENTNIWNSTNLIIG